MAQDTRSLGYHESNKKSFEHGDSGFEMRNVKMIEKACCCSRLCAS